MTLIQVYWNIHRGCWSVRSKKTGRIVRHALSLALHHARFHVSAAGRDRVRREKRKNVHAWIEGEEGASDADATEQITYNPYKYDTFVRALTGESVQTADCVVFHPTGKVTAKVNS